MILGSRGWNSGLSGQDWSSGPGGGPMYGQIDAHMEIHLKFTSNQPPQALTLHLQSARDGLKDGQTN